MKKLSLYLSLIITTNCSIITSGKCGDGILDKNKEEGCDDFNTTSGDGCTEECEVEDGFDCSQIGEPCTAVGVCGDGVVDANETCDDGNAVGGDGCDALCQEEVPECGNGLTETGEECDDGNGSNTDDCVACQNAECGDGFVQAGVETCDDNTPACTNCQLECDAPADCADNDACTANEDCVNNVCVNTAVDPDDGDQCTADVCNSVGGVSNTPQNDGFACDIDQGRDICLAGECVDTDCGDGFIDIGGSENCDDGNNINTDACPNDCTSAVCGDGDLEGTEECDDSNTTADDGCDQNCQVEGIIANCAADGTALETALETAPDNSIITVQNGDQCDPGLGPVLIEDKDLTVVASGAAAILSNSLTIQGDSEVSFTNIRFVNTVRVQGAATTIFQGSVFNLNSTSPALLVTGVARVAVIASTLTNNGGGGALRCDQGTSRFVVDRSSFTGSTGDSVVDLLGGCDGIIANSLFFTNNTVDAIQITDSQLDLVFSTFKNSGNVNGVGEEAGSASDWNLDSVIGEDCGTDPVASSTSNDIATTNSFIQNETISGITNQDPNLDASLHIGVGNGVRGQGNPSPITLVFDPATIFPGLNVFTHDFNNATRPQGNPDPGAFEETQ